MTAPLPHAHPAGRRIPASRRAKVRQTAALPTPQASAPPATPAPASPPPAFATPTPLSAAELRTARPVQGTTVHEPSRPAPATAPRTRTGTAPAPSAPGPMRSALAGLLTLLLSGGATLATALAAPPEVRNTVALGGAAAGALLLSVTVAVTHRTLHTARLLRERLAAARAETARALAQNASLTEKLADERERAAEELTRERDRLGAVCERLSVDNARLAEAADHAAIDRAATLSACANAAGRLQALATGTLADLRRMEDQHADENVLADLLHLDHRTAQAGRIADSMALLTGSRSGRRWSRPIVMESILRGAMGRISAYRRVRMHSTSQVAVAGHAAEGVMHALAELLDNAANFSSPTSEVHVYVEEVPAGVVVSVEDSGLVMSELQLHRAERSVSGECTALGGLSGTRLGLAVVGRLARKHGLKVSFRPSSRGGTGVVLMIPRSLLTGPDAAPSRYSGLPETEAEPAPAADPEHARPAPAAGDPAVEDARPGTTSSVVPAADPHPLSFSYAAARPDAEDGLDPDPVPSHGRPSRAAAARTAPPAPAALPVRGATPPTGRLPRRARGRTLADTDPRRAGGDPYAASAPLDPAEVAARTARFSNFRAAVRTAPPASAQAEPAVEPLQQEGEPTS
ncbi:ATP-binding protein [Streptomyces sp. NPDC002454]